MKKSRNNKSGAEPIGAEENPHDLLWSQLLVTNHKIAQEFNDATWKVFTDLRGSVAHIEIPERIRKLCGEYIPRHVKQLVEAGRLYFEESGQSFGNDDEAYLRECVTQIVSSWIKAQRKLIKEYVEEHMMRDSSVDLDLLLGSKQLVALLFATLDIGMAELRSVLGKKPRETELRRFPTPKGADWEDFEMKFTDATTLSVTVRDVKEYVTYAEMGFKNKGKKHASPKKQWLLLEILAEKGKIAWPSLDDTKQSRTSKHLPEAELLAHEGEYRKEVERMKQQVSSLSETLCTYFGLTSKPIRRYDRRRGWVPRFKILPE